MKDKKGNKVDPDNLGSIILKHLKDSWKEEYRNSGISAQGVSSHLNVYHDVHITIPQARKILDALVERGSVRVEKGHGNKRSEYILIKRQNSADFILED